MVKIRLTRLGKHKKPFFRIIAIDQRKRRDGAYLQLFGTYDPTTKKVKIDEKAIIDFLNKGAQPSTVVCNILIKQGIWAKFMSTKKPKTTKKSSKTSKKKVSSDKPTNDSKKETSK